MIAPARGPEERQLESLQRKIAEGQVAKKRRDELAFKMWRGGMGQAEIAERLDRADRSGGGGGVGAAATQKALFRYRKALEAHDGT